MASAGVTFKLVPEAACGHDADAGARVAAHPGGLPPAPRREPRSALHRRSGSASAGSACGRSTVDSVACWAADPCMEERGEGEEEARCSGGAPQDPRSAAAGPAQEQFTFCEPRYAPPRRATDVSLADWGGRRGTCDHDEDSESGVGGVRENPGVPPAPVDTRAQEPFVFMHVAGREGWGELEGRGEARGGDRRRRRWWWWRLPLLRWGIALAAFAGSFRAAAAARRRIGR